MNIAIIGCGLIGGSIGMASRARVPEAAVVAFDVQEDVAVRAVERGAAHRAASSLEDAAKDADFVFVCTPVGRIAPTVAAVASVAPGSAVITDVGSTKSKVVVEVTRSIPDGHTFLGGHPMAGSEAAGIDAAEESLFDGAWWILTPTETSRADAYQRLHGLLTALGARVIAVSPAEHDEIMAVISHMPQLAASTLMRFAWERGTAYPSMLALAAGGFRDMTRVAGSSPHIWLDICRENSAAIIETLRAYAERLRQVSDLLESGDAAGLQQELELAHHARRSLPAKEVSGALSIVRLPVPDRPGVLAEVTTTVGNLGINIEDLQIVHSTEGGRGTLHLSVRADKDHAVVEALAARGYDPRVERLDDETL